MTIETKFNIGDEVFFLHDNKIVKDKILYVSILLTKAGITVKYNMFETRDKTYEVNFIDSQIFATKQELLDSL